MRQTHTLKLLGKKIGMTTVFDENGSSIPCTVISMEPNVVTQIKTKETDGYCALQLSYDRVKGKNVKKIESKVKKGPFGHFKKANVEARKHLKESRIQNVQSYQLGQELDVTVFEKGKYVDVQSVSKGKGYQGVMKKYGFSGGPAAHGSGFHRHAGSTGMRSTPGRCFKGGPRASRMGGETITVQALSVVSVNKEKNLIVVKGSVPGTKGSLVTLNKSIKKA